MYNAMQPNLITMQLELGLKLALQVPYHQHVMLNRAPTKYICTYIYTSVLLCIYMHKSKEFLMLKWIIS